MSTPPSSYPKVPLSYVTKAVVFRGGGGNNIRVVFPNLPVLKQLFNLFERLPTISPFISWLSIIFLISGRSVNFPPLGDLLFFFHYENTPIEIYRKFHLQKLKIFRKKQQQKNLIFFIFLLKTDCGYSLEPPHRGGSNEYTQSMFLSKNKKNNVNPSKSGV